MDASRRATLASSRSRRHAVGSPNDRFAPQAAAPAKRILVRSGQAVIAGLSRYRILYLFPIGRCTGVSSAKFCFLMQMSTKSCRSLHSFAKGVMATNGSIGGNDGRMAEAVGHSCQSIPKRFRAFRSIFVESVATCCGLTGQLGLTCELKRESVRWPSIAFLPLAAGRNRSQ